MVRGTSFKKRSGTYQKKSKRSMKHKKGGRSRSKRVDAHVQNSMIPYNSVMSSDLVRHNDNDISSSKIFQGFYNTMHLIFPMLDRSTFSRVFTTFINTRDFTEFLKFVPTTACNEIHMSKSDINKVMIDISSQIGTNVSIQVNMPHNVNHSNIMFGGANLVDSVSSNDNAQFIMIQICMATFTYMNLPKRVRPFFVALVLYYFYIFLQIEYPKEGVEKLHYESLFIPGASLLAVESGTIMVKIFTWLRKFMSGYQRRLPSRHTALVRALKTRTSLSPNRLMILPDPDPSPDPQPEIVEPPEPIPRAASPRRKSLFLLSPEERAIQSSRMRNR
jgi:hypothetical protein